MQPVRVYRPNDRFDVWPHVALGCLVREIWHRRFQARVAFMRDFQSGYVGTRLGVVWNLILPLLPIGVYATLAASRVVPAFEETPAPVAIALNATLWFLFAGCIQIPINVTRSRNTEAMKTSMPLSVSIFAGFGQLSFETLLRLALVLILAAVFLAPPVFTAPVAALVIGFGCLSFLGLGLFLAIANIAAPDVQKVTGSLLGYGIFLSGVIFPLPQTGPLAFLNVVNPFTVVIEVSRALVFGGALPDLRVLAAWFVAGVLIILVGSRVFYVMERRIRSLV